MRKLAVMLVVAAMVAVLPSCNKRDAAADRAAVEELVLADTVHFAGNTQHDSTGSGLLVDGETTFVWWRGGQTHDSALVVVDVKEDSATVTWARHDFGWFSVLLLQAGQPAVVWNKPLSELVRLAGVYIREGKQSEDNRGWRLRRVSLAAGVSDSVNTVHIDSLRIESSLQNSVIVDPLTTFYRADSLVTFTPGELVTLTLYTNAMDGVAFLHTFVLAWPFYIRLRFDDAGSGVFTGTWHAQGWPSFHFAIFDVMNRSTIYSEAGAYDFNGWLFPYRVQTAK
jgi:hypothetical protein